MSTEILFSALKSLGVYGVTGVLTEATIESIKKSREKIDAEASIEDLEEEVSRQEVINKISAVQAKALQELAIARRIDTALEVEIEEFYEGNGEGGVGVTLSQGNAKAGINGAGSKITKRIYRFKGFRDVSENEVERLEDQKTDE